MASLRVVMPVHNAGSFLAEAVASVLTDLPDDGELVIVDDASTDDSPAVIKEVAATDDRVRVITHPRAGGVSRALNAGIQLPQAAEFTAVAEHDDVVLPGRFASQMAALIRDTDLGAVSSAGRHVGPSGRVFGRISTGPRTMDEFAEMVSRGEPILLLHPAVMYRTEHLLRAGLYDPAFDGAQDLELFNRMAYGHGSRLLALPEQHVLYRLHDSATSFSSLSKQRLITRFMEYRNRCHLERAEAQSFSTWVSSHRPGLRTRLRWARKDRGALMYRRAGLAWLEQRYASSAVLLLGASVLHPRWVAHKVLVLVGRA